MQSQAKVQEKSVFTGLHLRLCGESGKVSHGRTITQDTVLLTTGDAFQGQIMRRFSPRCSCSRAAIPPSRRKKCSLRSRKSVPLKKASRATQPTSAWGSNQQSEGRSRRVVLLFPLIFCRKATSHRRHAWLPHLP